MSEVQSDFSPHVGSPHSDWGKNSPISSYLVHEHENNTIWGEMRIQSTRIENEGMKKDAKDKASIHTGAISLRKAYPVCSAYRYNFQHFSKCSSQFRYHRSSVQRRRDPTHVYFICAFISLPNGILRETDAETELKTFGTALESLMYCSTSHEEHLRVPPSPR